MVDMYPGLGGTGHVLQPSSLVLQTCVVKILEVVRLHLRGPCSGVSVETIGAV